MDYKVLGKKGQRVLQGVPSPGARNIRAETNYGFRAFEEVKFHNIPQAMLEAIAAGEVDLISQFVRPDPRRGTDIYVVDDSVEAVVSNDVVPPTSINSFREVGPFHFPEQAFPRLPNRAEG